MRCIITFKQKYKHISGKYKYITLVTVATDDFGYPSMVGTDIATTLINYPTFSINKLATLIITELQNEYDGLSILKPNSKNVFEGYRYEIISFEGNLSLRMVEVKDKPLIAFNGTPSDFLVELEKDDNMWN